MKHSRLVILLAAASLQSVASAQPVQWRVEDGGNGHWYERVVSVGGVSWEASSLSATMRGGYLVTITSAAELSFLSSALGGRPSGDWIGLFEDDGGWRWVTGESTSYQNWGPGEPNNGGGGPTEDFGFQGYFFEWRDHTGASSAGISAYVVEWSADCNNDGLVDYGQILSGQLSDANNNGIPDGGEIITQPTDQNVGVDTAVAFVVEVGADAACTVPVTYQWQRRNPLVTDPVAPNAWIDLAEGSGIFGTRAPNLTLLRPLPALATGYRCKIGGGCLCEQGQGGFVYTNTVNYSVACPADFNADGGIDGLDLFAFFERWESGC